MLKIFISQPMNGLTDEEIKVRREDAIEKLKKHFEEEIEIIDSFFEKAPHDAKPLWFLGKSLELLSTADCALFLDGWNSARGCRIENSCAVEYCIPDIYENEI